MNIKKRTNVGIVGYDIDNVNLNEMRQMSELKNRINEVLISHEPEAKKKKYVSDDDLKLMHAVLSVFTRDYEGNVESAFDTFLKEQQKTVDKLPEPPAEVNVVI